MYMLIVVTLSLVAGEFIITQKVVPNKQACIESADYTSFMLTKSGFGPVFTECQPII